MMLSAIPRLNSPIARKLDRIAAERAQMPRPAKPASIIRPVMSAEERSKARWKAAFDRAEARAIEEQKRLQAEEDLIFARMPRRPTCRTIIAEVAERHGLTLQDIISESRGKRVVIARHEAMYLCMLNTSLSFPSVGRVFNRDHTSVMAGVRRHAERAGLDMPRGLTPAKRRRRP